MNAHQKPVKCSLPDLENEKYKSRAGIALNRFIIDVVNDGIHLVERSPCASLLSSCFGSLSGHFIFVAVPPA